MLLLIMKSLCLLLGSAWTIELLFAFVTRLVGFLVAGYRGEGYKFKITVTNITLAISPLVLFYFLNNLN